MIKWLFFIIRVFGLSEYTKHLNASEVESYLFVFISLLVCCHGAS